MTTNHKPATALPTLAHINGESNPFTVLGAIVPSGAPMRALLQIQDERTQLVQALRQFNYPAMETFIKSGSANGQETLRSNSLNALRQAQALLRKLGEL